LTFAAHQKPTVGDSKFSAVVVDHMGWLLCDGRPLPVADFQFLFNVIGYSFGGSGDTFYLPSMFGKVPGAVGSYTASNGVASNFSLGDTIGEYVHQLTIPEMPSHNHGTENIGPSSINISTSLSYTGISTNSGTPAEGNLGLMQQSYSNANVTVVATNTSGSGSEPNVVDPPVQLILTDLGHRHVLNPAGLDQYHNNVQPTLVMGNMFIYCGLYNFGTFPYQNSYVSTIQ